MRIDALQAVDPALGAATAHAIHPATASKPEPDSRVGGQDLPAAGNVLPAAAVPAVGEVHEAAELIDRFLRDAGRELLFSVDQTTGRTVVSVRDPSTGALIRQVPSEEVLRIARNLDLVHSALVSELA